MSIHTFKEFVNKATSLRLWIPKRKVKMNVCSIWPFAQISVDFCCLGIWQCARYFVAALFKELALIPSEKCEVSSPGLGLELPGLGLGFYDKVSVSSRNLSQVSEVTVSNSNVVKAETSETESRCGFLGTCTFFILFSINFKRGWG